MKLITPPIASVPYIADAPSLSTSTRAIAPDGMLFRSTPALSPGVAKLARRRPLSNTKVDETPSPRRLTPLKPRWPDVPSVMLAPSDNGAVLALRLLTISAAVVAPLFRISSRLMVCTGKAFSSPSRLMDEPVTSTRCSGAAPPDWDQADGLHSTVSAMAAAWALARNVNAAGRCRETLLGVMK